MQNFKWSNKSICSMLKMIISKVLPLILVFLLVPTLVYALCWNPFKLFCIFDEEGINVISPTGIKTTLKCDAVLYNTSLELRGEEVVDTAWGWCLRNYTASDTSIKQSIVHFFCDLNSTSPELCTIYTPNQMASNNPDIENNDLSCTITADNVIECGDVHCVSKETCVLYRESTYGNKE